MIKKSVLMLILIIVLTLAFNSVIFAVSYINETEPNNSISTADIVNDSCYFAGAINYEYDQDYYKLNLGSTKELVFRLSVGSKNPDLYLLNSSGNLIASSTNGAGVNEVITETLSSGTYYVVVVCTVSGSTGNYTGSIGQ